eukprot:TRINITY_DN2782_c0_g1_i1.p1 TRINITY_DN2782_c0_g1~~TRINITY_DN2782_c0_g1_i1.p1  ORF type:complete len:321 (-),score=77.37 TRINITY_DN2782_c0_g1_i1:29-949(-)
MSDNKWVKFYKYNFLGPAESFPNKVVNFTLLSKDADGRPADIDITVISVKVHGAENLTATVTDAHLGSYNISFEPTKLGIYNIDVSIGGKLFFQEKMKTIPSDHPLPDPLRFECEGSGVKGSKVGQNATFTLKVTEKKTLSPHDVHLNDLEVFLEGPEKVKAKVSRTGTGVYKVEYKANKKGTYHLNIEYQEKQVLKGVSSVSVSVVGSVDPSKTVAELGTPNPKANEKLSIKFVARDSDGDVLTVGGDSFDVEVAGPVLTEPEILDFNNGTYRIDCLLPKAGRYECDIIYQGTHIKNSPLKFKAE